MSGDDDEWAVDDNQFEEPADSDESDETDEWRFSLEDLEDDPESVSPDDTRQEGDEPEAGGEDAGGNVFGSLQSAAEEVESGSPSPENVVFVVVGIVLALLLFAQFFLVIVGGP